MSWKMYRDQHYGVKSCKEGKNRAKEFEKRENKSRQIEFGRSRRI